MKDSKSILRWRTVGWGVLFGVVCIVLCFYFPTEYSWVLCVGVSLITMYQMYAYTRYTQAVRQLKEQMEQVEEEDSPSRSQRTYEPKS